MKQIYFNTSAPNISQIAFGPSRPYTECIVNVETADSIHCFNHFNDSYLRFSYRDKEVTIEFVGEGTAQEFYYETVLRFLESDKKLLRIE